MASDIRAWRYTDDLGNTYQRGLAEYIGVQVDGSANILVGGRAVVSGDEPMENLPAGVKPRTVALLNAAGTKRRRIVIFDTTCPLWVGTSSSVNLQDGSGASAAYTVYSRSGERRRVRAPGV